MTNAFILTHARVFDGVNEDCTEDVSILVAEGRIQEIGGSAEETGGALGARRIDLGGRTLMPGLIDAHVHAFASDVSVARVDALGEAYRTAHAVRMLGHALDCGFTTVRDVGGGNYSLYRALVDGLISGPRYFYSGRVLSMTGGHADFRLSEERPRYQAGCGCDGPLFNAIGVIADGVDGCVRATREEFRQGAHCIKIMASGGVASPTDPIWMNQYREDEIRAIVGECNERRSYTAAHCHPIEAIRRCVEFGVRSIEHGTLIDDDTARFVAERGAFIVPTMAICFALVDKGKEMGFPAASLKKLEVVARKAISGMDSMRRAGVKVGFGTDLLGATYTRQSSEFTLRREVFTPVEILRQATSVNAELMGLQGEIGCIHVGARADLIVVDGDPTKDIGLLGAGGRNISLVILDGKIMKSAIRLD